MRCSSFNPEYINTRLVINVRIIPKNICSCNLLIRYSPSTSCYPSITYLTGDFTNSSGSQLIVGGPLDENPVVLQGQGGDDVYVANWAPNGDLTWVRTIGSTGRDRVFQLRVGPAGSVYLSGINAPSIVVGGNGVPSTTVQATQYGVFVTLWSGSGEFQWLRTADGGDVYPGDLQLDAQGRVYLGGDSYTLDTVTIQGSSANQAISVSNEGSFIASWSQEGDLRWVTTANAYVGLMMGNSGEIYASGQFAALLVVKRLTSNSMGTPASVTVQGQGSLDLFVAKWNTAGHLQWVQTAKSPGVGYDRATAVSSGGSGLFEDRANRRVVLQGVPGRADRRVRTAADGILAGFQGSSAAGRPCDMIGDRETVSIVEACRLVGVSRRTIYNWMSSGKVEYLRTAGGAVRILSDTLWRSLSKRTRRNGPPGRSRRARSSTTRWDADLVRGRKTSWRKGCP